MGIKRVSVEELSKLRRRLIFINVAIEEIEEKNDDKKFLAVFFGHLGHIFGQIFGF